MKFCFSFRGALLVLLAGFRLAAQAIDPVPETLAAPSNDTLVLTAQAKGFQIYVCQPRKDDATQYEWALKAPEAELFDAAGMKIGRHYGGPTWESADGSKVIGQVKNRAPAPQPEAVPWLLLNAKSHEGNGILTPVDTIQRLETTGGQAPSGLVDSAKAGQELRIPYTAVYYFYAPKPLTPSAIS